MESPPSLRFADYLLVTIFSIALFGYCGFSGRPLTMHEARLPETAREMQQNGNWLLPASGNRPWLERPPLPHWCVIAATKLLDHGDREWIVRLPSAVMGLITVLLTAWMAGRCVGRGAGMLSGLVLASSFEFYRYAGAAEDDIFLAALVALCMAVFVHGEFLSTAANDLRVNFFRGRPWQVWAFFFLLGLTNLAKGPLLGILVVGSAVGLYLLSTAISDRKWRGIGRYLWLWGWLLLIALTIGWPLWAYHKYPDVLDNWKYDYMGRLTGTYSDINQKWYYYAGALAVGMLPWTPACIIGLMATAGSAWRNSSRPMRFFWCWAIAPLIVFSIPRGKHHHYLVPLLAPWAILAAVGLLEIGKAISAKRMPAWTRNPWIALGILGIPGSAAIAWFHPQIPAPPLFCVGLILLWIATIGFFFLGLNRGSASMALATLLGAILLVYCWGETFVAPRTDQTIDDTAFLHRVSSEVPSDGRLFINADLGNLDFFRAQFYSRPQATLLHNLTFLRDDQIHDPLVYVITRAGDESKLRQLGETSVIDQSPLSHEITGPKGRLSLFRLKFDPALVRYPAPTEINSLQAMQRAPGPFCGPPL